VGIKPIASYSLYVCGYYTVVGPFEAYRSKTSSVAYMNFK